MTLFVAIEGGDGAGKHTAANNVCRALEALGHRSSLIAFPRYQHTVAGKALGEFLSGRTSIALPPRAAATLYGLDRFESRDMIRAAEAEADVIIFDRYIASNVAYQAARSNAADAEALMEWIVRLELETFGLPAPDLSIYLDTPVQAAQRLMLLKTQRSYTDRTFDENEADLNLQNRVRVNYAKMVAKNLLGPWHVVAATEGDGMRDPQVIAGEIVSAVTSAIACG